MNEFKPITPEDKLLYAYWEETGGRLYLEVPVGSHVTGLWPKGSKVRRIDGVRVLSRDPQDHEIVPSNAYQLKDLANIFRDAEVEVIEAKDKLNRVVFGQAVAGVDMFERQYDAWIVHPVVIYEIGDPAMGWVCRKHGVRTWQIH